jgi:hypothetical protein
LLSLLELLLGLDRGQLMLQLTFEAVLDRLKTGAELLECSLFILDPIVVLLELSVEESCILLSLLVDDRTHLLEHWVVLLVQGRLIQAEVFVV